MPRAETPARRSAQRGLGFIEVLVAVLVIGIGLLPVARMAGRALVLQQSAQLALIATTLAHHHAERARLNLYGFDLGQYDLTADAAPTAPPPLDPDADDRTAALAVAAADRHDLLVRVAQDLPDGAARAVSHADASARVLELWLLWRDPSDDSDGATARATCRGGPPDLDDAGRRGRRCLHWRVVL
jgi:type IV pilus assembly protein PilV